MTEARIGIPDGAGTQVPARLPQDPPKGAQLLLNGQAWPVKQALTWGYVSGVTPQNQTIMMQEDYAHKIVTEAPLGVGATLKMRGIDQVGGDLIDRTFKGLWLLERSGSEHDEDALLLADSRWHWPRAKVTKAFNLVRKSNDRLSLRNAQGLDREILNEAEKYFLENTIRFSDAEGFLGPYSALDIVLYVLHEVLGYSEDFVDTTAAATSSYIPQDILLEGQTATQVIQRFLELGGNNLYLDDTGKIIVYDQHEPFDEPDFNAYFPRGLPPHTRGEMYVVDYEAVRPHLIEVQSRVEKELLFTYYEPDDPDRTTSTLAPATTHEEALAQFVDGRIIVENVTITVVEDQIAGLPRGTVVPIVEALEAFGNKYGNGPVTLKQLRENYGMDGGAFIGNALKDSGAIGNYEFDPQAVIQFNAIMRDYRTLFRIPQVVTDQLLDINPYLADILNPETGSRAPSEVFSVMSWFANMKYRVVGEQYQGALLDSFRDANGNGRNPYQPIPASVDVKDKDIGLYRVSLLEDDDRPGKVLDTLPGEPVDPSFFVNTQERGILLGGKRGLISAQGLKGEWECSVVLSVVPLMPNNHFRLYRERIGPADGTPEGKGPMIQVLQNADTARFALAPQYSAYAAAERGGGAPDAEDPLQSNARFGGSDQFVNRRLIQALGFAEADRIYKTFFNQLVGSVSMSWTRDSTKLKPRASLADIRYRYEKSGQAQVDVTARRITQPEDILNLLPEPALRLLFRQLRHEPQG